MLIEQAVQLGFRPLLLVREQFGELAAPLASHPELLQKSQGQFIQAEEWFGSALKDPKKTEAIFGW